MDRHEVTHRLAGLREQIRANHAVSVPDVLELLDILLGASASEAPAPDEPPNDPPSEPDQVAPTAPPRSEPEPGSDAASSGDPASGE